MEALALGLVAALAWGIHDICVRYVGRNIGIYRSLFVVLTSGCVFLLVLIILTTNFSATHNLTAFFSENLDTRSIGLSSLAGLSFLIASVSVFKAFASGPVRVVAPILGAFPVFSVIGAVLIGSKISVLQVIAVLMIVSGIAVVARTAPNSNTHSDIQPRNDKPKPDTHSQKTPMIWAFVAALAFATTFGVGQAAVNENSHLPSILITRVIASIGCAVLLIWRQRRNKEKTRFLSLRAMPILLLMGLLDTAALGLVLTAGSMAHAEFAAVASSLFGLFTILIAWIFLKEAISKLQSVGVLAVFTGIAVLGLSTNAA